MQGRKEIDPELTEKIIKKVITTIMDNLLKGSLKLAAKHYYAEHITVLSRLLAMEIKYNAVWNQLTELRHAVDQYAKELEEFYLELPPVPKNRPPMSMMDEMFNELDAVIRGGIDVTLKMLAKVRDFNESIEVDKPRNVLDLVFGNGGNITARNSLCDSIKKLTDIVDNICDYRDRWSGVVRHRRDLRLIGQGQCSNTLF